MMSLSKENNKYALLPRTVREKSSYLFASMLWFIALSTPPRNIS